ncbi:MAG: hypothetical protein H6659_13665 [Ardenticatenaceae bacterium]|nr:hypothetical protein [Ardenticatenaceae bacterium]
MSHGPIDFIVLSFSGNKFKGEILDSLVELVESETIRIIDLLIVIKDEQGDLLAVEIEQHDPEISEFFAPLDFETNGMITAEDVEMIGANLENNSTAAMMLFENTWAVKFKEAVLNADGQLLVQGRIPSEDIDNALAEMAEIDAQAA